MVSLEHTLEQRIFLVYENNQGEVAFDELARGLRVDLEDDDKAAELIEADGRARIGTGKWVELDRYLSSVPRIEERPVPLDAAIDVTLRSLSGGPVPGSDAIETLVLNYPHLSEYIRDAALLAEAICSTNNVRGQLAEPPLSLPCDFGPPLSTGVARFELRKFLGGGSAGRVYQAWDRQLSDAGHEALVAVKLPVFGDLGEPGRQRFVEEAAKARRVIHPNVVRVLDRGTTPGGADYIVYELVEGGTLLDELDSRGGRYEPRAAVALLAQIARGVHAAHMKGLVHCDLKPGNILLTAEGQPKVADFGIAVRRDFTGEDAPDLDQVGNIAFSAPEQYRMEDGALAIPADVYALGGMLFHLLTGKFPNGDSAGAIAERHRASGNTERPPSPRAHRPGIDADLDAICARAMASDPSDRYASAAALADDLDSWLRSEPIAWRKPSLPRRVSLWCRRRRGLAVSIAVGSVVAVAAGGFGAQQAIRAATAWHEAEVKQARVDGAQQNVLNAITNLKWLKHAKFDEQMSALLMGFDSLGDKQFLGSDAEHKARWKQRESVLRARLKQYSVKGLSDSLDALMWQSCLGFWLLCEGKPAAAADILHENLGRWRARLADGDPWLTRLSLLETAARAEEAMSIRAPGGSDEQSAEWESFAEELEGERAAYTGTDANNALRRPVVRALIKLYGPEFLDRPQECKRAQAELKSME